MPVRQAAALLLAIIAALSACGHGGSANTDPAAADAGAEAGSAPEGGSATVSLAWAPCSGALECASLVVPIDYCDPSGGTLSLPLTRLAATQPSARIGSLVVNPGGPGVDAGNMPFFVDQHTTLRSRFDIVSFTPRGVAGPVSLDCGYTTDPVGPAGVPLYSDAWQQWAVTEQTAHGSACEQREGALLAHLGTNEAVRDLDLLREALGDAKLSFLGVSYGTRIGALYATAYPSSVRAIALDSPMDPAPTSAWRIEQGMGPEAAFAQMVTACRADALCATNDPDADFDAVIAALDTAPVAATATRRALTPALIYLLFPTVAAGRAQWLSFFSAMHAAAGGDYGALGDMLATSPTTTPDTDGLGATDVHSATLCADAADAIAASQVASDAAMQTTVSPHFGRYFAYQALECVGWPAESSDPVPQVAPVGAPPILVVATTGDFGTPYVWGQRMAQALPSTTLLTYEGVAHGAFDATSCVTSAVTAYFVDLSLPAAGTTCPAL